MTGVEETLLSLGKERDCKKLEAFIGSLDIKQIYNVIKDKILNKNLPQLLDSIFRGLSDSGPSQMKRLKVTEHTLKELQKYDIGNSLLNTVICRICLEVDKFNCAHLIRLTEWCIESIQNGEGDQMSWKDLLPKLLSNLEPTVKVDHSGTEMTGSEYKSQVISTLCMAKWKPGVVTSLAGMFAEIPLSPDEHLQVVHKLCKSMEVVDPTGIPPFVNQLLHLCKNQLGLPLFLQLQQYFTAKLYIQPPNTDSSNIDSGNRAETLRAESTVLFYINKSASLGHGNIKDLIKSLKNISTAPEIVLNPFFLSVLLSVSCIQPYEEQIFDILKATFTRIVTEEERRSRSTWIRNITPPACDVRNILTNIVENSGQGREMVKTGLVNLGFVLLSVSAMRGREAITQKLWSYGRLILVKLVKKQHYVASTVLQTLCDRIIIGQGVTQYTDCLLKLSVTVPLLMDEHQNILIQLMEQLLHLPGHVAQEIVRCLLPLMQTFPSLRNALILILRKSLFRCNVSTRQMAVTGFLLLLKTLDVRSFRAVSQCSQSNSSSYSYSSQVYSQVTESSEAIGLELLGVLRRCFVQQAEVRLCLYQGLYDAICKNPILYPLVLDLLLDHFNLFYKPEEDALPPLDFSKAVIVKGIEAVLQEPLANLVFVVQQVVTKANSISTMNSTKYLAKLEAILDSLSKRMIKCTLEDFSLDNTVNLADNLPESQQMYEMFRQMLGVYEALMSYTIATWTNDTPENYQKMVNLFKGYSNLVEFSKLSRKAGKKAEGEGGRGQKKKKAEPGNKGRPSLKLIPTILDLKTTIKILQLLYQRPLDWASTESANMLRGRREFTRYIMQATLQQLQHIKTMKSNEIKHFPAMLVQCTQLGSILYQHCVEDLQDVAEVDKLTSVLSVECFYELLSIIKLHCEKHFPHFLDSVAEVPREHGLEAQLQKMIEKFQSHLAATVTGDDEDEDEPGVKKLPMLLISVVALLAMEVPCNSLQLEVYNWVKSFAKEKALPNPNVVKGMVSLLFKLQIHCKTDGVLFDSLALQLLSIMGPIDTENRPLDVAYYAVLSDSTKNVCLQQLCGAIKYILDDIDWVVARLRGEFTARAYPSEHTMEKRREFLKGKERDVCRYLSHCVKIVTVVIRIALPPGPTADTVLKLLVNLYATLSGLTKYFITRSSKVDPAFQAARFTSVVQLAGIDLANHVQWLILHIMSADSENNAEENKKKKKKDKSQLSKVLKDSKFVPKIVFGMEIFEKFVIQLSNKSKVNLMENVKPSTSRDFRIKMEVLEQALVNQDENESEESNAEDNDRDENGAGNSQISQPPKKKRRTT